MYMRVVDGMAIMGVDIMILVEEILVAIIE